MCIRDRYIYYLSAEGHFILKDSTVLGEVIPIPDNIDDVKMCIRDRNTPVFPHE